MSTVKGNLREDFSKKPEDLAREADDVREDMEKTIDQLMNRLSPGELINQAFDRFRSGGDSPFTQNLVSQVQNNPVPAVLTACGLAWLMASSKQPPASAGHSGAGLGEAKERASSTASHLKEQMSETRQHTMDSARHTMESARQGVQSAQKSYNELLREQPLLMGALAVAAGAAIGALLPASSVEDEMFGETSAEATEELKGKAQQKMEEGQEQAAATSSSEGASQERPVQESRQTSSSGQHQPVETGLPARPEEHRSQSPMPPSGRSPM